MKVFRSKLAFPLLCLAVGLLVFGVSHTLLGQGPGPGDNDTQGPGGNTGGNDPPTTGAPGSGGTPPTSPPEELAPENDEPGPVGMVNEVFDVLMSGDAGNNVTKLRSLLAEGANPNTAMTLEGIEGALGRHPMPASGFAMVQAMYDKDRSASMLKALLDYGADPNALIVVDGGAMSLLHWAVTYDLLSAVDILLKAGANPNVQFLGKTPEEIARRPNPRMPNRESILTLLQNHRQIREGK